MAALGRLILLPEQRVLCLPNEQLMSALIDKLIADIDFPNDWSCGINPEGYAP